MIAKRLSHTAERLHSLVPARRDVHDENRASGACRGEAHFAAIPDPGLGLPHARIASGDSFVACPDAAADLSELFLESGASVDFLYLHDYRRPEFVEEVFRICADRTAQTSVFVIEGIRYTSRMRAVWRRISRHEKAGITFDLYDLGIIFFDKTRIKQDYIVNF